MARSRIFKDFDEAARYIRSLEMNIHTNCEKDSVLTKKLFNKYHLQIMKKVPVQSGRTKKSPKKNSKFNDNILVWDPTDPNTNEKYVGYIYKFNRTGIPEWDIVTARENNDKNLKNYNNSLLRALMKL